MKALDDFLSAKEVIFGHVGYIEDERQLPIEDFRLFYWRIEGSDEDADIVRQAEVESDLVTDLGYLMGFYIYREWEPFVPKWVYRGADYTLIIVKDDWEEEHRLAIYDNSRERPTP